MFVVVVFVLDYVVFIVHCLTAVAPPSVLDKSPPSVYHQMTNDPLSGKSSVMSMAHDRAYKRLIMGTMVNISCEPSLYEELEGQV